MGRGKVSRSRDGWVHEERFMGLQGRMNVGLVRPELDVYGELWLMFWVSHGFNGRIVQERYGCNGARGL